MGITLKDVMTGRSNEELVRILTIRRGEFTKAAIAAAENEVRLRNIPSAQIDVMIELQARFKERELVYANEPLQKSATVVAIAFPLIARLIYTPAFNRQGYERKLDELDNAACRGYLLKVGLVLLTVLVSRLFV